MTKPLKLFAPGPGDVDEDVLASLATPVIRHYGPEWMVIYNETQGLLKQVFKTKNEIFFVPGAASSLMDMAIGSLLATGEKIIVGDNGFFGGGVAGRGVVVDAVSSMGGADVRVDEWGIDICVTTPNKCLEALPGIGFISVSPRAWELVDAHSQVDHGWYLNLKTWRQYATEWGTWHPTPVTLPTNIILALRTSLLKIFGVGLEAHFEKYSWASQAVRHGLRGLGFEMFVDDDTASPMVTGVCRRSEFEVAEMSKWLGEKREIAIGGGLGELSGKI